MQTNFTEDTQLINLIKENFDNGSNLFVTEYIELLTKLGIFYGLKEQVAEEIASDVLFDALIWIQDGKFRNEGKLKTWLCKILKNRCFDEHKKNNRIKEKVPFLNNLTDVSEIEGIEFNDNINDELELLSDEIGTKLENCNKDEGKQILYRTYKEMKDNELTLIFDYLNNLKYRDIAEREKCTEDAAQQRVGRALKHFCEIIAPKVNMCSKTIYEKIKEIHKQDSSGRISGL